MDEREVDWSDLPVELLSSIGKYIQDRIGVVRFRSVCASWRSSIPPPCDILPPLPLPLPYPTRSARRAYVSHRTYYRFKLPDDVNPNPSTCSSKGWLVKVEEFEFDRKCLFLNPLSNLQFKFSDPEGINLLDYQVVEVSKGYELQSIEGIPFIDVNKLVLFPDSAWNSRVEGTEIFALYHKGKLGHMKYGDKNWTLVEDLGYDYDDIIVYKGQTYVIDTLGMVSWIGNIGSSIKLVPFLPPFSGLGNQKHLVVSCGELYLVDRSFDREMRFDHGLRRYRLCPKTVNIKVCKLDEEWGRWALVKNLGDQVFFLGKDSSFSVSATEFSGCKGNCVYFTDDNDIGVSYLEDQKTGKIVDFQDQCHLIWPPPSLLCSKSSSKC